MIYIIDVLGQQNFDFISNTQFWNAFFEGAIFLGEIKFFEGANFLKGHEFFEGGTFSHYLYN